MCAMNAQAAPKHGHPQETMQDKAGPARKVYAEHESEITTLLCYRL